MTKKHYIYISIVLLLILTNVIIIHQIIRKGIGVTPDSVVYLSTADNFQKGNGLVTLSNKASLIPMTHFPPLYPVLIAMGEFINIKPIAFCSYLNIIVYIFNILLCGIIVYKSTNRNIEAAIFSSILVLSSYDVLRAHICAMTDPIFILLSVAAIFTLMLYIDKQSTVNLIICSLLVSIAFLLRYVGLSLIITVIVGILLLSKRDTGKIVADCAIFLAISTLPMVLWIARNVYLTGNPFNRTFGYHKLSLTNFPQKVAHLLQKLGSLSLPVYITAIIVGVLTILLIIYFLKPSRRLIKDKLEGIGTSPCLMIDFIVAYLLVVIISLLFFDSAIYLGFRILLPIIVFAQLITIILLARYLSNKKLLILVLIIAGLQLSRWDFNKIHKEELVYAGPQWTQSTIIKKVKELPPGYKIYTNGPDVIYYLTGKLAYSTPEEIISIKNVQNPKLRNELKEMSIHFNEGKYVLVWLGNITWRNYLLSKRSIVSSVMLTLYYQAPDGSIYTSKNNLKELLGDKTGEIHKQ